MSEVIVDVARAYNKHCIGCKRHGADVMVSFSEKGPQFPAGVEFHDNFLTTEQAEWLVKELTEVLKQNKDPELGT